MEALAETNERKPRYKNIGASVSGDFYDRFRAVAFEQKITISSLTKSIIGKFMDDYYSQGIDAAHAQIILGNRSSVGYGRFKGSKSISAALSESFYNDFKNIAVAEGRTVSEIVRILCENYVYRYENGLDNTTTAQDAPGMPSETGFRMLIDLA